NPHAAGFVAGRSSFTLAMTLRGVTETMSINNTQVDELPLTSATARTVSLILVGAGDGTLGRFKNFTIVPFPGGGPCKRVTNKTTRSTYDVSPCQPTGWHVGG